MQPELQEVEKIRKKYEHSIKLYKYREAVLRKVVGKQNELIKSKEGKRATGWRLYDNVVNRVIQLGVDHQDSAIVDRCRKMLWKSTPGLHKHLEKVRKRNSDQ